MVSKFCHAAVTSCLLLASPFVSATTVSLTLPELISGAGTEDVGLFNFNVPYGSTVQSASLSGTFGNDAAPNSSGVDLFLSGIQVASCGPYDPTTDSGPPCTVSQSPTPWSTSLQANALLALGNGSAELVAVQTSPYAIQLGPTTLDASLSPSLAAQFYNNTIVPISNSLEEVLNAEREAAVAASAAGLALYALEDIPAGNELFEQESEMLAQADELDNGTHAEPFSDPPLVLPPISPAGPLTQSMINEFQQIDQNVFNETALFNVLFQQANQIQALALSTSDPNGVLANFVGTRDSIGQLGEQTSSLYGQLQSAFEAANINIGISNSDIQNTIDSINSNGFPGIEDQIFSDFGVSPDQILRDLNSQTYGSAPGSLDAVLSEAASVQTEFSNMTGTVAAPEPSSFALFGAGLAGLVGLVFLRLRRRKTA